MVNSERCLSAIAILTVVFGIIGSIMLGMIAGVVFGLFVLFASIIISAFIASLSDVVHILKETRDYLKLIYKQQTDK
ncbi:MAG: hypothetical protein IJX97_00615 [Clostridia bacterium]|nr:hypothetical protein [Clostridia bacterium]